MRETVSGVVDTNIVADFTIRKITGIYALLQSKGGSAGAGIDQRTAIAALYVYRRFMRYRFSERGLDLTVRQFNDILEDASMRFIQVHIMNYIAYTHVRDFYDWLCDNGKCNHAVEGHWRKMQRAFEEYQGVHKKGLDKETWTLFLDHMAIACDRIDTRFLRMAVTDFLDRNTDAIVKAGQITDTDILAQAYVCFILLTAMRGTYQTFFREIAEEHGVDISADFRYADLGKVSLNTMYMCEKTGMRFVTDADGDRIPAGADVNTSERVGAELEALETMLNNKDKMDNIALRAMHLHPKIEEEYKKRK